MTNETQSGTRKRIVAYDDDVMAIRSRYVRLLRDNDVQLVYFIRNGDEQAGRTELASYGVPKELAGLATIVDRDMIFKLVAGRVNDEQSGIPFPQNADQYLIDGLGYFREGKNEMEMGRFGFVPIASRLPKERVTIISSDHKACEDAEKLGYNVKAEF